MKVIKDGTKVDMVIKATCRHCHSELEFNRSETKLVYDNRDGDYRTIDCPVCKQQVTMSKYE